MFGSAGMYVGHRDNVLKEAGAIFKNGKRALDAGNLSEAIKKFTAALRRVDEGHVFESHRAIVLDSHASRALAYERQKLYMKALEDIDHVISKTSVKHYLESDELKYLKSIREKALLCKLRCMWGLGQNEEALAFIESVLPDYQEKDEFKTMHEEARSKVEKSHGNGNGNGNGNMDMKDLATSLSSSTSDVRAAEQYQGNGNGNIDTKAVETSSSSSQSDAAAAESDPTDPAAAESDTTNKSPKKDETATHSPKRD